MLLEVTWEMSGTIDIQADTVEEALEKFYIKKDNIPLPEGTYVDDSFRLTTTDPSDIEDFNEWIKNEKTK